MPQIILASTSPRRRSILHSTELSFRSIDSGVDESAIQRSTPQGLVRALAQAKAQAVSNRYPHAIIIAGDTIVVCNNKILGKPHTSAAAARMLKSISGKTIAVLSALSVMHKHANKKITRHARAKISLRRLTEKEIRTYVKTKEPLDKAGAFAIQGRGAFFVNKVHGDYSAIIGLPLPMLAEVLPSFGIEI